MRLYDSETGEPIVWRYSQDETYHMSCWDLMEGEEAPMFDFGPGRDVDRILAGSYVCCRDECNRHMKGSLQPPAPPRPTEGDHFI